VGDKSDFRFLIEEVHCVFQQVQRPEASHPSVNQPVWFVSILHIGEDPKRQLHFQEQQKKTKRRKKTERKEKKKTISLFWHCVCVCAASRRRRGRKEGKKARKEKASAFSF